MTQGSSRRIALLLAVLSIACTDRLMEPEARQASMSGIPVPANGEFFRVMGSPTVYLSFGGVRYALPDQATLFACTGSFPGIVRTLEGSPALGDGSTLPSVSGNEWVSGAFPVKGDGDAGVYIVVGCVKNVMPDLTTLEALFGRAGLDEVVTVPQTLIDALPSGPMASAPLRRPGTLLKGSGPEVRWVTYMGGSLSIPGGEVLDSYCRFGAGRVPDEVDDAEFAAYPVNAMLPPSASNCAAEQPPIVLDGEIFRVLTGSEIYLSQRGRAFLIPDAETLAACTGANPGVVRILDREPALRSGGALPSVNVYPFMHGDRPVRSESNPAVFAVVGCARSLVPDPETFFTVFGPSGATRTEVVPDAVMAQLPGAAVVRLPLRLPGTLIRTATNAEIRWVTFVGGALSVPNTDVLRSHCRTSVVTVSADEFGAYPARARLEAAAVPACGNPSLPVLQPDFRMPLPEGLAWEMIGQPGTGANTGLRYYSVQFAPRTEGLPGQPPVEAADVPVIAAAAGTVLQIGNDAELGHSLWIDHGSGFSTIYGHLAAGSISVETGEVVLRGKLLGLMGSSGAAPTTRLHFEVRYFEQGAAQATWLDQSVIEGRRLTSHAAGSFYLSSNRLVPAAPAPANSLATGLSHSCALTRDGAAYCWGDGKFYGQLGNGSRSQSSVPVAVAGGLRFTRISAGVYTTCALTYVGETWCWGYGRWLEDGSIYSTVPARLKGGHRFREISVGGQFACGLTTDNVPYCWGMSHFGRLGSDGESSYTPRPVAGGHSFTSIDTNWGTACALTAAGQAWCWGLGAYHQLATGTAANQAEPVAIAGHTFSQISVGATTVCGRSSTGTLCWGVNYYGTLGQGVTTDLTVQQPALALEGYAFERLSSGGEQSSVTARCALTATGEAWCWGANRYGQLGTTAELEQCLESSISFGCTGVPVPVAGRLEYSFVDAGSEHSCGMTRDQRVFCWGRNRGGQVGDGTMDPRFTPVEVTGNIRFR
jgi:hypothetical protein